MLSIELGDSLGALLGAAQGERTLGVLLGEVLGAVLGASTLGDVWDWCLILALGSTEGSKEGS